MQETEKKEKCTFFYGICIMSLISLCDTISKHKISLSKSFCLSRSGLQRVINDHFKFLPVLVFFGAFEITAHVKQWLKLLRRCFDGSELLVRLLSSFNLISALHFL